MKRRDFLALIGSVGASLTIGTPTIAGPADEYPSKTVKFLVPLVPGFGPDVMFRVVGEKLKDRLGQPFIVENRPGAGNILATSALIRSAPDGYVLGFSAAAIVTLPLIKKEARFDFMADTTPIIVAAEAPTILGINGKLPFQNVKELIAYAKGHPGELRYGSNGHGTTPHLLSERFANIAGIKMVHVPNPSSVYEDLARGDTQMVLGASAGLRKYIETGAVRAIAATSATRGVDPLLPELPTLLEQGVNLVNMTWYGISGPAGIPSNIVAKLNKEINEVLKISDVKPKLNAVGLQPVGGSPEELTKRSMVALADFKEFAASTGIEPQ